MASDAQHIRIPLDERGMPDMTQEVIAQVKPLLNTKALAAALAKAAQKALEARNE